MTKSIELSDKNKFTDFKIKEIMWKDHSVGLAEAKLGILNRIDILKTDKNGDRYYPNTLFITRSDALKYPTMAVGRGTRLRQIPIADLSELVLVDDDGAPIVGLVGGQEKLIMSAADTIPEFGDLPEQEK